MQRHDGVVDDEADLARRDRRRALEDLELEVCREGDDAGRGEGVRGRAVRGRWGPAGGEGRQVEGCQGVEDRHLTQQRRVSDQAGGGSGREGRTS